MGGRSGDRATTGRMTNFAQPLKGDNRCQFNFPKATIGVGSIFRRRQSVSVQFSALPRATSRPRTTIGVSSIFRRRQSVSVQFSALPRATSRPRVELHLAASGWRRQSVSVQFSALPRATSRPRVELQAQRGRLGQHPVGAAQGLAGPHRKTSVRLLPRLIAWKTRPSSRERGGLGMPQVTPAGLEKVTKNELTPISQTQVLSGVPLSLVLMPFRTDTNFARFLNKGLRAQARSFSTRKA
jgi:hypothetical protein